MTDRYFEHIRHRGNKARQILLIEIVTGIHAEPRLVRRASRGRVGVRRALFVRAAEITRVRLGIELDAIGAEFARAGYPPARGP